MCSPLAPRAAAPGFGATAFLDRRRGVTVSVTAMARASSEHKTGEPIRRARPRTAEVPAAPAAQKRGRHDVDPAASSALRVRMDKELVALQGLLKRAKLLPRSAAPAAASSAKRRPSPSKPATDAAHAPAKQQRPAAKNPIAPGVANKQQRPAEAPATTKQQHPVQRAAAAAAAKTEARKQRRPEEEEEKELARAAAREEFRRMLVEMEKAALPDWTIYPEDLEELGIAPYGFVVTRTRKQAWLEDHAKKVAIAGV